MNRIQSFPHRFDIWWSCRTPFGCCIGEASLDPRQLRNALKFGFNRIWCLPITTATLCILKLTLTAKQSASLSISLPPPPTACNGQNLGECVKPIN